MNSELKTMRKVILMVVMVAGIGLGWAVVQGQVSTEQYVSKEIIFAKWGSGEGEVGVGEDVQECPKSISKNKSNIYILDFVNKRIEKYNLDGKFVKNIIIDIPPYICSPDYLDFYIDNKEQIFLFSPNEALSGSVLDQKTGKISKYKNIKPWIRQIENSGKKVKEYSINNKINMDDGIIAVDNQKPELKIHKKEYEYQYMYDGDQFTKEFKCVIKKVNKGKIIEEITIFPKEADSVEINFLGIDDKDNVFLYIQKYGIKPTGEKYGWHVRTKRIRVVHKYNKQGKLLARVPIRSNYMKQPDKEIIVDDVGNIYQMFISNEGTFVIEYSQKK